MKLFTALTLVVLLFSPFAQAETTLFGLTLGKSTVQEVAKSYTLQDKKITPGQLENWNYYRVSGEQFGEPLLQNATLFFDDTQTLGSILFIFSNSLSRYKELEEQLSRQYPHLKVSELYPAGSSAFQNDTTSILLTRNDNAILLTFTDLNYRTAAYATFKNNAREVSTPKKEP